MHAKSGNADGTYAGKFESISSRPRRPTGCRLRTHRAVWRASIQCRRGWSAGSGEVLAGSLTAVVLKHFISRTGQNRIRRAIWLATRQPAEIIDILTNSLAVPALSPGRSERASPSLAIPCVIPQAVSAVMQSARGSTIFCD